MSERIPVSKITSHQNFTDDVIINQAIKNGEWKSLFESDAHLLVSEIITQISQTYALDDCVSDRLELQYSTFIGNAGNTKVVKLENENNIFDIFFRTDVDKDLPESTLTLQDLTLKVRYIVGDEIERDCS